MGPGLVPRYGANKIELRNSIVKKNAKYIF